MEYVLGWFPEFYVFVRNVIQLACLLTLCTIFFNLLVSDAKLFLEPIEESDSPDFIYLCKRILFCLESLVMNSLRILMILSFRCFQIKYFLKYES